MPPPNNKRGNGRNGPVNRWHRNTAIVAVVGLLYLLATGLPLQFSTELALGQRFVSNPWVLDWYGLEAPSQVWRSGDAVHLGDMLLLGGKPRAELETLAGSLKLGSVSIAAGGTRVIVLHDAAPQAPETVSTASPVLRVGAAGGTLFVETRDGLLRADESLLNWHPAPEPPPELRWAEVEALQGDAAETYRSAFRTRMLNLERWLQDLHSGRFFGRAGILVVDALSLLLLVLAGTGLVLWWRYPRRRG